MHSKTKDIVENDFLTYISKTKELVDRKLSEFTVNLSHSSLFPQLKYALLSEGKRLRPIMVLLSAQSVGGDRNEVMPLALAFELLHTATLVHDDIIDKDYSRRGVSAVHEKWSVEDAILVGDCLISLAVDLISDYSTQTVKIAAKTGIELCDGEYMDITQSLKTTTEEEYFAKIKRKSASLFRTAAQCGAIEGRGSPQEVKSLALFGEHLGIAYQLQDDLQDLMTGKYVGDLINGRVTLPIIHLYQHSNSETRTILEKMAKNETVSNGVTEGLVGMQESIAYCRQKIIKNVNTALKNIAILKESIFKAYLKQAPFFVVSKEIVGSIQHVAPYSFSEKMTKSVL